MPKVTYFQYEVTVRTRHRLSGALAESDTAEHLEQRRHRNQPSSRDMRKHDQNIILKFHTYNLAKENCTMQKVLNLTNRADAVIQLSRTYEEDGYS